MSLKQLLVPAILSAIVGCVPAKSPQPHQEQFHYQCDPNGKILRAPENSEEHLIFSNTKQEILTALCANQIGTQPDGDEVACSANLLKGHAKDVSKMDALQNLNSRRRSQKKEKTYTIWANLNEEGNYSCTRVHTEKKII